MLMVKLRFCILLVYTKGDVKMSNICFVEIGFIWGLIISIILLGTLLILTVLVIKKKHTPVAIDEVSKDVPNGEKCVLSGGRNYIVGGSNKVKSGEYIVESDEAVVMLINGVSHDVVSGKTIILKDGDNLFFEGINKKLDLVAKG